MKNCYPRSNLNKSLSSRTIAFIIKDFKVGNLSDLKSKELVKTGNSEA